MQSGNPPTPPALPAALQPQNLDLLPNITSLLLRLQTHINAHPSNPGTTPQPASTSFPAENQIFSQTPLSTKEIPAACDELKQRLRRARAAIKEVEGVEMGVEEQEDEIRRLEERVAEQRRALRELRDLGGRAKREREVKIEGDVGDMDVS